MGPQSGGQSHHRQVEGPQEQGLDGVSILVNQQPPGNLLKGDPSAPVSGGLIGEEDKEPQGKAGVKGVDCDHRTVIEGVGALSIPQKDGRPRRRLEQAPGTLGQEVEQDPHYLTLSRLASSPSGET